MTEDPALRAGDTDRDRTITRLREAYAEGRLSNDEFDQRMARAQESRTFGELAELVTDLPAPSTSLTSVSAPVPSAPQGDQVAVPEQSSHGVRNGWLSWLGVSLMVNVIWLGSLIGGDGDAPYYWPIWVMGPWGVAMVIGTIKERYGD